MVEVMFEILLFSAYLSAALISVVIAVYAISVSYLGRETSRSIWFLKKRQVELKNRIKKLGEKIDVGEMEKEIRSYRQEETTLKNKLRFLSFNGAVLLPSAALFIALFFSLAGIYTYPRNPNISSTVVATLAFNTLGFVVLLKVLKTVEWSALRIPLPSFEVFFKSGSKEEKMMTKEKRELRIIISNNGDAMAEDIEVFVFFPLDFKISPRRPYYKVVEQWEITDRLGYNAVIFDFDKIHINVQMLSSEIGIEAPERPDKYKIPVCIYERNIGESEHELFLEVVD